MMKSGFVAVTLLCILLSVSGLSNRHILLQKGTIHTLEVPSSSLLSEESNTEYEWLVHVSHTLTAEDKQSLNQQLSPYSLGGYLPHNTYLLVSPAYIARKIQGNNKVLWVGVLDAEHKGPAGLTAEDKSLLVLLASSNVRTSQQTASIVQRWKTSLSILGYNTNIKMIDSQRISVTLTSSVLEVAKWIAQQPESHWIEPNRQVQFHTNQVLLPAIVSNNLTSPLVTFTNTHLDGSSQIVGILDSGLDFNSCYFNDTTPPTSTINEAARKVIKYTAAVSGDTTDETGHGTFTSGIIAGQSTVDGSDFNGVAPGSKITFYDISKAGSTPTSLTDLFGLLVGAYEDYAGVVLASFGTNANWYNPTASAIDEFTFGYEETLVVVSAGNMALSDLALAKNALVVGASQSFSETLDIPLTTNNYNYSSNPALRGTSVLAKFSAYGPTPDSRIKPDIVAPGQRITAASTGACGQETREGTSFAAAAAAGAALIVRDYFAKGNYRENNVPMYTDRQSAALVKAMLINSGQTLLLGDATHNGTYIGLANYFPSGYQGFGRIQLDQVLGLNTSSFSIRVFDEPADAFVSAPQMKRYCFTVPSGAKQIKLTLVWSDIQGDVASGVILVNDLDLIVYDTNGNEIRTQTNKGQFDRANNVEQIIMNNPEPGVYAYAVYAHRIIDAQPWSLVVTGDFEDEASCASIFDDNSNPVCPNGCSNNGQCVYLPTVGGGNCNCNSAYKGVDCSESPCLNDCSRNGVCDPITSTCTCYFGLDPNTGCATPINTETPTPEPVVIKQSASAPIGYFVGVAILGLIVGGLLFGVIGFFCAVKYMEKKRDELMKDQDNKPADD